MMIDLPRIAVLHLKCIKIRELSVLCWSYCYYEGPEEDGQRQGEVRGQD